MSGFAGIFRLDGESADRAVLDEMMSKLVLWKPDAFGEYIKGPLALGHLMRHNTPESLHETLPYQCPRSHHVIVSDARIDNRDELFDQLSVSKDERSRIADSQLILMGYEKWGEEVASYLLGAFVFVIWDAQRKNLFCGRDHFGQRILYYYYKPGTIFAFATTLRALLTLPGLPVRLNEEHLAHALILTVKDLDATHFMDIKKIPGAHTLRVNRDHLLCRRYWELVEQPILQLGSTEEYLEQFRELFTEAVRCRLRSAFPLGTHLSGGQDSSSIACVAAPILAGENKRLAAFGLVPDPSFTAPCISPDGINNEIHFMEAVNSHLSNLDLTTVCTGSIGAFDNLQRRIEMTGSPALGHFHRAATEEIARQAEERNIRTMLTGAVGNYTISAPGTEQSFRDHWSERFLQPAKLKLKSLRYQHLGWDAPWMRFSPINPQFARSCAELEGAYNEYWHGSSHSHKRTVLGKYYSNMVECGYMELSTIHGVEHRHPALDKRIVEFCLSLPQSQLGRDGRNRLLTRDGLKELLPQAVIERKQPGYQATDCFERSASLWPSIREELASMRRDTQACRMLDVRRMIQLADDLPKDFNNQEAIFNYAYALMNGITTGRFLSTYF